MLFQRFFGILVISLMVNSCGIADSNVPPLSESFIREKPFIETIDTPWNSAWSRQNTFIWHWMTEPKSLHPSNGAEVGKYLVFSLIHGYLLNVNLNTLELSTGLAASEPSLDETGLIYAFRLRPEARWDDGSPVTASDVIFSFKAVLCPLVNNPDLKPYLDYIAEVKSAEPLAFSVRMTEPYLYNYHIFTEIPILQASKYDPNHVLGSFSFSTLKSSDFNQHTTPELLAWANQFNSPDLGLSIKQIKGCGPYSIDEWQPGAFIKLIRKKQHWTRNGIMGTIAKNAPDTIVLLSGFDEQALILALRKQEVDASVHLSSGAYNALVADSLVLSHYHNAVFPSFSYSFIAFNTRPEASVRPPFFKDIKLRKAFAALFNVQEVIEIVYEGLAGPVSGPVSSVKPDFETELKPYEFNIDKACELLSKAGWKDSDGDGWRDKVIDGLKVDLRVELAYASTSPVAPNIAEMFRENAARCGADIVTNPMNPAMLYEKGSGHDFDMLMSAFGGSSAPDDFKQLWHSESWHSGGTNFSGFGNEHSDALIDSIRTCINTEERYEMSRRFQKMVHAEVPWIPIAYMYRKALVHKRWKNVMFYLERPHLSVQFMELNLPK